MTKEQAIELIKEYKVAKVEFPNNLQEQALEMAIKALEQPKPMEKFENAKDHIRKLAGDYKCWDNRLSHEESLELCNILKQQSDDCVSRQATLDAIIKELGIRNESYLLECEKPIYNVVKNMPPVTPTHGTCKDCKHYYMDEDGHGYHCEKFDYTRFPVYADFYCADFEK